MMIAFKDFQNTIKNYFSEISNSFKCFLNSPSGLILLPIKKKGVEVLILFLLTFSAYINTIGHQLTFDDEQIIKKNDFVLRGIRELPSIFKHDTYHSYYKNAEIDKIWPGGRYRPLSAVSFAIEQELIGTWKYGVPRQFIWDTNANGSADPDEDVIKDYVLNEEDFFARGTGLRHFNNIFLFAISVLSIYFLLSLFFKNLSPDIVFFGCVLFALHPIHTEVIANIKSRDEIFSLLFIIISLIFALRFFGKGKNLDLIFFSFFFLLAILSKEYAILLPIILLFFLFLNQFQFVKSSITNIFLQATFFVLSIALVFYFHRQIWLIAIIFGLNFFFILFVSKNSLLKIMNAICMVLLIYLALRLNAVSSEGNLAIFNNNIITNPYLVANHQQIIASKIVVLLRYVGLLFFPFTQSCDYSYNSIPYSNFTNTSFYISILIYVVLFFALFISIRKKSPLSFFIFWFIIFLIPVSNIFVNIGATMGERLIYHSSLGFCFAILFPLEWFVKLNLSLTLKRNIVLAILGMIFLSFMMITIKRNNDWENNFTLYQSDVKKYPNNLVLLSGVADEIYKRAVKEESVTKKRALVQESISYIDRGLQINAAYYPLFNTLALDFYLLDSIPQAAKVCKAGLKVYPDNRVLLQIQKVISKDYVKFGIMEFKKKNYSDAINYFDKALECDRFNTDAIYNKAYVYKVKKDTANALVNLEILLKIEPKKEALKLLKDLKK